MITQHTGVVKGFSHPSLFPSGKCVGGYVETFVTIVIILVPTMSTHSMVNVLLYSAQRNISSEQFYGC